MKDTDNEEPTFFVSRRGKPVGVHQVDLSDIDIESHEPTLSAATKKARGKSLKAAGVQTSTSKPPRQKRSWTKKKSLMLAALIALLLLPLVLAEIVTAEYATGVSRAKQDIAKVVSGSVLPSQKKATVSAETIKGFARDVNDIVGSMCRGGLLDNAAGLYPRAKSAYDRCKGVQTQYASLTSDLYVLEAQARYMERLGVLVKPVATPITDGYAVIGSQQASWHTLSEELKKLSPPAPMTTAHAELATRVSAVASAWSALNTANNSQNSSEFQEAEKKLSSDYEAVREASSGFIEILADTQAKISKDYNALK